MAKSIAQQVTKFLETHPAATNTDLYQMFPKVRENTLRNYKYKFKNAVEPVRNNRKKVRTKKVKTAPPKTATQSLRSKVFEFFRENPTASNQSLYEEFSSYSKNKLRHYKASFFKSAKTLSDKTGIPKTANKLKKTIIIKKPTPQSLEKRVAKLEAQVEKLSVLLADQSGKTDIRSALTGTTEGVEKKIRELENTISSFISAKRKKIKTEMTSLEEIQQVVSDKIGSFIKGFK